MKDSVHSYSCSLVTKKNLSFPKFRFYGVKPYQTCVKMMAGVSSLVDIKMADDVMNVIGHDADPTYNAGHPGIWMRVRKGLI